MIADTNNLILRSEEHAALRIPAQASTLDGYLEWINSTQFGSKLRGAWHLGEIFLDMSPENLDSHNRLKAKLKRALDHLVEDGDRGLLCIDGVTFTNEEAGVVAEPDAQYIS